MTPTYVVVEAGAGVNIYKAPALSQEFRSVEAARDWIDAMKMLHCQIIAIDRRFLTLDEQTRINDRIVKNAREF